MTPRARGSRGDRRAATGDARGFVIAGTHSGVGKTSLSLGLMGALRRAGYAVAPSKSGPTTSTPPTTPASAAGPRGTSTRG